MSIIPIKNIFLAFACMLTLSASNTMTAAASAHKSARKNWFLACICGTTVDRVAISADNESHNQKATRESSATIQIPSLPHTVMQPIDSPDVEERKIADIKRERLNTHYQRGFIPNDGRSIPLPLIIEPLRLPPQNNVFEKRALALSDQSTDEVIVPLAGVLPPVRGYKRSLKESIV